jgi:hypothetical protein
MWRAFGTSDLDTPEPYASLAAAEILAVDLDADANGEVTLEEMSWFAERFLNTQRDPRGPFDPQQVGGLPMATLVRTTLRAAGVGHGPLDIVYTPLDIPCCHVQARCGSQWPGLSQLLR